MGPTFRAACCTASASGMSIMRGRKPLPNSLCKRSASACLRTEPNTRNPFETSTFVVPQPIPVETPVTTTSLLVAIAFLLSYACRQAPRPRHLRAAADRAVLPRSVEGAARRRSDAGLEGPHREARRPSRLADLDIGAGA